MENFYGGRFLSVRRTQNLEADRARTSGIDLDGELHRVPLNALENDVQIRRKRCLADLRVFGPGCLDGINRFDAQRVILAQGQQAHEGHKVVPALGWLGVVDVGDKVYAALAIGGAAGGVDGT